jgi:hypothetical protein
MNVRLPNLLAVETMMTSRLALLSVPVLGCVLWSCGARSKAVPASMEANVETPVCTVAAVTEFGADPSGAVASDAAFATAFAAGVSDLYVPPGTFKLTAQLQLPARPFRLRGADGASLLWWDDDATSVGLSVTFDGKEDRIVIEGLSFVTGKTTGMAIHVDGRASADGAAQQSFARDAVSRVIVRRNHFHGKDLWTRSAPRTPLAYYWPTCIDLVDVNAPLIEDNDATASWRDGRQYDLTGEYFLRATATEYSPGAYTNPVLTQARRNKVRFYQTAIYYFHYEGIHITENQLVQNGVGIRVDNPSRGTNPGLVIRDNHINAYQKAIWTFRQTTGSICGNYIYSHPRGSSSVDWIGIQHTGSLVTIHHNILKSHGTYASTVGIQIDGGANVELSGNIISSMTVGLRNTTRRSYRAWHTSFQDVTTRFDSPGGGHIGSVSAGPPNNSTDVRIEGTGGASEN